MPARIIVVERNEKIGGLISGQLREKSFDAIDVRQGAEAAVELRKKLADLIIIDHQIALGGVKTARILRLHEKYNTIPIILGLPPDKDEARGVIKEGQASGLQHFLLKPFTLNALQKKITDVLERDEEVEHPTHQQIRDEIRNLSSLPAMPAAHANF